MIHLPTRMSPCPHLTPHSNKPGVNLYHILQAYTPPLLVALSSAVMSDSARKLTLAPKKNKLSQWMLLLYVGGWSSTQGAPGLCALAATWLKLTGCSTEKWKSKHSSFPEPLLLHASQEERHKWGGGRSENWNSAAAHQGSWGTDSWDEASWTSYGDLSARNEGLSLVWQIFTLRAVKDLAFL